MEIKNSKGIGSSIDLTENSDFRTGCFDDSIKFNHTKKDVPWDSNGNVKDNESLFLYSDGGISFSSTYINYINGNYDFNIDYGIPEKILEDINSNLAFISLIMAYHLSEIYIENNSRVRLYFHNESSYSFNYNYYTSSDVGISIDYKTKTITSSNNSIYDFSDITPKEFNDVYLTASELDGSRLITSKNHNELKLKIKLKEYLKKVMDIITPKVHDRICKSFKNKETNQDAYIIRNELSRSINYTMRHKNIDILYDQPYYLGNKPESIDYLFLNKYNNSGVELLRSKYSSIRPEELNNMEVGLNGETVKPIKRGNKLFINI